MIIELRPLHAARAAKCSDNAFTGGVVRSETIHQPPCRQTSRPGEADTDLFTVRRKVWANIRRLGPTSTVVVATGDDF
jgi:hypothetical protein